MATTAAHNSDLPQTSLYVGDLHPKVTEQMLHQKFGECGPVLSVRVCIDVATRDSLGYGYVNFQDPKDAERALENMNYDLLEGRPIRLMWCHRDPSLRKSGKGNVFIKNLHKSIEQKQLYDTFKLIGNILSCKIALDEAGNSKGYGFVHFDSEASAQFAIRKLNQMVIMDRVVYVGKFIPSSERKSDSGKAKFNNCYVKNFSLEYGDEWLRNLFAEFGEIKSAVVAKDENGKSKGFGFVCFHDPENAEKAVLALNSKKLDDQNLYVTKALRKEERQEELRARAEKQRQERQSKYDTGVNLYVKNLDDTMNDEQLRNVFSHYGTITSAKVMTDANGSRLFGFVCFLNPDEATRAVTAMNGTIVGSKPLYVAIAQRKEDRRAFLVAEHQKRVSNPRPPAMSALGNNFYGLQRLYINQPRWNRPVPMGMQQAAPMGAVAAGGARGMAPTHYALPAAGAAAPQLQAGAPALGTAMQFGNVNANMYRTQAGPVQAQQAVAAAQLHQQQQQSVNAAAARQGMMQGGAAAGMMQSVHVNAQVALHQVQRNQMQQQSAQSTQQQQQRTAAAVAAQGMQMPAMQLAHQQHAAAQQQAVVQSQAAAPQISQAQHVMSQAVMQPPQQRPSMAAVAAGPPASLRQQMAGGQARMMQNQSSGVRFSQTARNVAAPAGNQAGQAQQAGQSQQQAAQHAQQQETMSSMTGDVTMSKLAQMPSAQQKKLLGNKLFALIEKRYGELAGKLTGMLLEMEPGDIIHMLESEEALTSKLQEAIGVINARVRPESNAQAASATNNAAAKETKAPAGEASGGGGHGGKGKKHHANAGDK